MKFIMIFVCATYALFGADLAINKSFSVGGKLKPTTLYTTIRVDSSHLLRNIGELSDENRGKINTSLNAIISEAKKGDICKGGSYAINPIVSYDKDVRKTIGQNVDFSLECKFGDNLIDSYNKLLSNINKIVASNTLLALPQPALDYRTTNDEISSMKENLFNDFLTKLPDITKRYSTSTNKICKITEVSTNDEYTPSPMPRLMSAKAVVAENAMDSTTTSAPIANENDIKININVKMICE